MRTICQKHKIKLVTFCPACRGSATSPRKAASSAANGRLGGRPRKDGKKPKLKKIKMAAAYGKKKAIKKGKKK